VSTPELGVAAPDFSARNQHGETVRLSGLRGAPVLLVFYPFAFTGTCSGELADLQQALPTLREAGARLLAVSTDTIFSLRVFAEREGYEFDLLSDHWPHGQVASTYGVFDGDAGCAVRGSFLLDADGLVRWKVIHQIGEARDVQAHLSALADSRTAT
jgi:peroxiredoxin